jgi:hypothetical protein
MRWSSNAVTRGFTLLAGLAVACGSTSSAAPPDALDLCTQIYQWTLTPSCGGPVKPAAEKQRVEARVGPMCTAAMALAGDGMTSGSLRACASALQAESLCNHDLSSVPACDLRGSLAGGSPCSAGVQCQSGRCSMSAVTSSDGGAAWWACGTCTPLVAAGDSCNDSESCQPGSVCDAASSNCVPVRFGAGGDHCDGIVAQCNPGLYCDLKSAKCAARVDRGAPCVQPDACNPPLTCVDTPYGTCQDRGQVGASCAVDADCEAGLGCGATTYVCGTVTWASGGQPCGEFLRCLVGACPSSPPGMPAPTSCPTVIADGQPCNGKDPKSTCDTLSSCINGTCMRADSPACN